MPIIKTSLDSDMDPKIGQNCRCDDFDNGNPSTFIDILISVIYCETNDIILNIPSLSPK